MKTILYSPDNPRHGSPGCRMLCTSEFSLRHPANAPPWLPSGQWPGLVTVDIVHIATDAGVMMMLTLVIRCYYQNTDWGHLTNGSDTTIEMFN